jgi:hypothetical protein
MTDPNTDGARVVAACTSGDDVRGQVVDNLLA